MTDFIARHLVKSPDCLFINGRWCEPSGTSSIAIIQPSTEDKLFEVAGASHRDIDSAVEAAREAFDAGIWPRLSHAERASYLTAFGEEVRRRSNDFADLWTDQVGLIHSVARLYSPMAGATFEYYAGLASAFPFSERHDMLSATGWASLIREPVGVVAVIVPWNAAAITIAYKIAPALLAGCTIVLKAAPEAPGEAYLMAEIAEAIGLPAGVLNVLMADREASECLVRNTEVDKVTFTGSSTVGKRIGALCAERVARCTLELGGKSAAIILDDYDLSIAAKTLTASLIHLSGQVCAALTRVVVSRDRHDALIDAIAAEMLKVRVGDPYDSETQMGPLITSRQRSRVEALVEAGRSEGADLVVGGGRPKHLSRGFYFEPTLFGNVDNSSIIAREEVFGPVLSVIAADNEADAVKIANDSIYGLNASVFTNDAERAYRVARELRSGSVGQNGSHTNMSIAFGGFKQSGMGREGGIEGLLPFLETKVVTLEPGQRQDLSVEAKEQQDITI